MKETDKYFEQGEKIDAVVRKKVKSIGSGAMVLVPKEHIGKDALVFITHQEEMGIIRVCRKCKKHLDLTKLTFMTDEGDFYLLCKECEKKKKQKK